MLWYRKLIPDTKQFLLQYLDILSEDKVTYLLFPDLQIRLLDHK